MKLKSIFKKWKIFTIVFASGALISPLFMINHDSHINYSTRMLETNSKLIATNNENDTTLINTEIRFNEHLFKSIFVHDKGYAIDWACYDRGYLNEYANTLKNYINNNINSFFINVVEPELMPVVSEVSWNFTNNFKSDAIFLFNLTYRGKKDNIINNNLKATIKIILNKDLINNFWPYLEFSINTWINSSNNLSELTSEALRNVVMKTIEQHENTFPDIYLSDSLQATIENILIDNSNFLISNNQLFLFENAITIKPRMVYTNSWSNYGKADNLTNPTMVLVNTSNEPSTDNSNSYETEINNNWWVWLIITIGICFLTLLIVLYALVVYRRRQQRR